MNVFVSEKVLIKEFGKCQFPHKSVNLFFIFVEIQDGFVGGLTFAEERYENSL